MDAIILIDDAQVNISDYRLYHGTKPRIYSGLYFLYMPFSNFGWLLLAKLLNEYVLVSVGFDFTKEGKNKIENIFCLFSEHVSDVNWVFKC